MMADNTTVKRPPLVVEIVGPAGVGKTTLARALSQRCEKIVVGVPLRRIRYIPFFIDDTLSLLPTFLRHYRNSRWFTREEVRAMVYLQAWYHTLRRQASSNDTVTILDHGPVYRLGRLREFGPEITQSQRFETWWDKMLNQWASTLDIVIWLDAPDAILVERIRARNQWHFVKGKSELEVYEFLARSRTSYEQIISKIAANGGPRVLRFDTDQKSLPQIMDKVLAALGVANLGVLDQVHPNEKTG